MRIKIAVFSLALCVTSLLTHGEEIHRTPRITSEDFEKCHSEADGKKLAGDDRKAFMTTCVHERAGVPISKPVPPGQEFPYTQADQENAERLAHSLMESRLKDPYSAHWTCYPMRAGSLGSGKWGGKDYYGLLLPCEINAKNSYGAYIGTETYVFLIIDGKLRRAVLIGSSLFGATQQVIYDF